MPLPTVPSPRTWASGNGLLVPQLRADVSDTVALLTARPFFSGQNDTGASWASGSDTALPMDVELSDAWNTHDATGVVAASSLIYAQVPGWYLARASIPFSYTSSTQQVFAAGFSGKTAGSTFSAVRGALQLNGSTRVLTAQCTDLIEQTATGAIGGSGDYIQPTAYAGASTSLASGSTQQPAVSVRWVCATTGTQPLPVPPLATVPSPITSAWMNANVRDTINFLCYPPICKATQSGSYSIPTGTLLSTWYYVPLTTAVVDNYSGLTTGTSACYTAPVAGRYFFYGQYNLAAASSTAGYAIGLSVNNGTPYWGDIVYKTSDSTGGGVQVARRLRLNAGDVVYLASSQNSGSTIAFNTTAANQTRLIAIWEGI